MTAPWNDINVIEYLFIIKGGHQKKVFNINIPVMPSLISATPSNGGTLTEMRHVSLASIVYHLPQPTAARVETENQ